MVASRFRGSSGVGFQIRWFASAELGPVPVDGHHRRRVVLLGRIDADEQGLGAVTEQGPSAVSSTQPSHNSGVMNVDSPTVQRFSCRRR